MANEITKRETVYADFLENASKLLLNAYTHDEIVLGGDEQHLIGLINRMRLFAPPTSSARRKAVLKAIVEILAEAQYRAAPAGDASRCPRVPIPTRS